MKQEIHFRMCLAQVVFDVRCLFPTTALYCKDYYTETAADHLIVITQGDIEAEAAWFSRTAQPEQKQASDQALELSALCRQIALLLPQNNRVLFHGSCLAYDGSGILFTAKSGTGKSTHTRLWREVFGTHVTMVNDDKPFLRIEKEQITACGTPWQGKHNLGQNISVPLKAVVLLCRGEENTIEPIAPRDALPMLLQQTFSPEQPEALLKTVALVQQLSTQIPIYRLFCNMDPDAAITAKEGIDI